jgi:GTP cyclohydrolase I
MSNQIEKTSSVTDSITDSFTNIITQVGENTEREGLVKTPKRAAVAFEYLTRGYKQDLEKIVNGALFTSDADGMVVVKDIELYSLCEHHLLPFIGKCHIAYVPNGKILGLSKFARITDMFACRLQTQEALSNQIASAIMQITQPKGVAVIIEADHLCMKMRGVEKQNSVMKTSVMKGLFRDDERTRNEFLQLLRI